MTEKEFIFWLQGYITASINRKEFDTIKKELEKVLITYPELPTIPVPDPFKPYIPEYPQYEPLYQPGTTDWTWNPIWTNPIKVTC